MRVSRVLRVRVLSLLNTNAQARLSYALSKEGLEEDAKTRAQQKEIEEITSTEEQSDLKRTTTTEQWDKVMWSDESNFTIFPNCGKLYVQGSK